MKPDGLARLSAAAAEIGNLTDREILIAGAIAYWCEGSKAKPSRHIDRVGFINSDAAVIMFFLGSWRDRNEPG